METYDTETVGTSVTDEKIFYFHKYIIFLFKCSKIKFAIPIVSTF